MLNNIKTINLRKSNNDVIKKIVHHANKKKNMQAANFVQCGLGRQEISKQREITGMQFF